MAQVSYTKLQTLDTPMLGLQKIRETREVHRVVGLSGAFLTPKLAQKMKFYLTDIIRSSAPSTIDIGQPQ